MKNLKRVLSLALSGIMLVGMMAVGAGAVNAEDFTDADEISHTEAVSVSTALRIIDGKEDGSFDPAGNVTRGQMAKMITRAMFGGDDPILGTKTTPTFTDIKGRWDEKYIEYCANQGIINGRGDGTFDPEGNVTGTEAAKMLLVALGYNVEVYKLTGTDWAINTNSLANGIDAQLYSGLGSIDPSVALNREQTAQMVYNALNAKVVEMRPSTNTNGVIEYQYITQATTMLWRRYGAIRVEGVVTNNEFVDNSDGQKGKTYIVNTNPDEVGQMINNGVTHNYSGNFEIPSGKDEFGRAVILYVKPSNSVPKSTLKAEVLCDIILDENTVVSTTKGFGSGKNLTRFAKDKGLKFENTYASGGSPDGVTAQFFCNYDGTYAADGTTLLTAAGQIGELDGSKLPKYTNKIGTEVILIDNDLDGVVDVVLQNEYAFGQVTKYSTKDDGAVTVRTGNSSYSFSNAELKDIAAYDDIAKDDYVNVTKVSETWYIEKAEHIEGVLNSYKKEKGVIKNVTVEDVTYDISANAVYAGTKGLNAPTAANIPESSIKNEGEFYLDAFGYLVGVDLVGTDAFAYVGSASYTTTATGLTTGTLQVYAVLEDGTQQSYIVSKYYNASGAEVFINGTNFENTAAAIKSGGTASYTTMVAQLYKYSLDGDGRIKLTEIATAGTGVGTAADVGKQVKTSKDTTNTPAHKIVDYTKGQSTFQYNDTNNNVIVNENTVFFYAFLKKNSATELDSVVVYTGKDEAPSLKDNLATTLVLTTTDADKAAAVLVTTESVTNSNYLYAIKYLRTDDNGDVYQAWLDGEVTEITTNGTEATNVRYVGPYTYTTNAKGLYTLKRPDHVTTGYASEIKGNSLIVKSTAGSTEFDIKDAEQILIDGEDSDTTSVGKKDTVVVVHDQNTVGLAARSYSVYVVEEYSDDNTGATLNTSASHIRQSLNDDGGFDFDIAKPTSDTSTALSDVLDNEITFPYSFTSAKVYKAKTADGKIDTTAEVTSSTTLSALAGATSYESVLYLRVTAEDGVATKDYKLQIVGTETF